MGFGRLIKVAHGLVLGSHEGWRCCSRHGLWRAYSQCALFAYVMLVVGHEVLRLTNGLSKYVWVVKAEINLVMWCEGDVLVVR